MFLLFVVCESGGTLVLDQFREAILHFLGRSNARISPADGRIAKNSATSSRSTTCSKTADILHLTTIATNRFNFALKL